MKFNNKKTTFFIIAIVSLFFLVGCLDKKIDTSALMDDITFEVASITPGSNTETVVTITMTNNSDYTLVQNTVLYSLVPTPFDTDETTNPISFIAEGNKLNIKPGESVDLAVSYPSDIFQKEFGDYEYISEMVHFIGYFDQLKEDTRLEFQKNLSLEE